MLIMSGEVMPSGETGTNSAMLHNSNLVVRWWRCDGLQKSHRMLV